MHLEIFLRVSGCLETAITFYQMRIRISRAGERIVWLTRLSESRRLVLLPSTILIKENNGLLLHGVSHICNVQLVSWSGQLTSPFGDFILGSKLFSYIILFIYLKKKNSRIGLVATISGIQCLQLISSNISETIFAHLFS